MNLIRKTINAHLQHLDLSMDKDRCVWKDNIMLFCNTVVKEKQEEALFYWLEGFSSCYDNEEFIKSGD